MESDPAVGQLSLRNSRVLGQLIPEIKRLQQAGGIVQPIVQLTYRGAGIPATLSAVEKCLLRLREETARNRAICVEPNIVAAQDGEQFGLDQARDGIIIPLVDRRKDVTLFLADADNLLDFVSAEVRQPKVVELVCLVELIDSGKGLF